MKENAIYFHIGNGGVEFAVEDNGKGPLVTMSAVHFGHPTGSTGILMKRTGLKALADFFARQSEREFSEDYCIAAETPGERVATGVQSATGND